MLSSFAPSFCLIILTARATATTFSPTISSPTPSPTTPYDICANNKRCQYEILIEFDILYSFTDDSSVDNTGFTSIITSTTTTILTQYIPNSNNIVIDLKLTVFNIFDGEINIDCNIGISNEDIYNRITNAHNSNELTSKIHSVLPDNINSAYPLSGFTILSDITSQLTIITGTNEYSNLFGFISFDFAHYCLYDWIVFIGCILLVFLCCFCGFWCLEARRKREIPTSNMNAKTGNDRVSIFRRNDPGRKSHVQQSSLFEYSSNQPSPDQRSQNGPNNTGVVQTTVYKSNYAASPMRHEWNNAMNAVADAKGLAVVGVGSIEDEEIGGKKGHLKGAESMAMSTVSFGKQLPEDNMKLINEQREDEYYDYEEEFDNLDGNANVDTQYEAYV